jgi:hypothetical protein
MTQTTQTMLKYIEAALRFEDHDTANEIKSNLRNADNKFRNGSLDELDYAEVYWQTYRQVA